eukprot:51579-Eustigmatos_ZCMA.PRE.1
MRRKPYTSVHTGRQASRHSPTDVKGEMRSPDCLIIVVKLVRIRGQQLNLVLQHVIAHKVIHAVTDTPPHRQ